MLTRHAGALQLDKSQLAKPEDIRNAIQTVINDESYKKNAEKLAEILRSLPNQPIDAVLKHCDFAVKFGNLETLKSEGRSLNFVQYYSIDILVVVVFLLLALLAIIFCIFRFIFRKLCKLFFGGKSKLE